MTSLELSWAREEIEEQIRIVIPDSAVAVRQVLLDRLKELGIDEVTKAHSFIVATLAEKVALNVVMIARFIGVNLDELEETA